jgi:hypothetical protein
MSGSSMALPIGLLILRIGWLFVRPSGPVGDTPRLAYYLPPIGRDKPLTCRLSEAR